MIIAICEMKESILICQLTLPEIGLMGFVQAALSLRIGFSLANYSTLPELGRQGSVTVDRLVNQRSGEEASDHFRHRERRKEMQS
jgi:hypothetical protein